MNLAVDDHVPAAVADERPAVTYQPSRILADLFSQVEPEQRLTILEVGRIAPETVAFFGRYDCRIQVLDLFAELAAGAFDLALPGTTLQRRFQDLFAFEAGTAFDIVLLWDFPHYLDESQLRAFSRALWPWLKPATRAHGFGVHSAATMLVNREYGIVDQNTLAVRPRRILSPPRSPHPPSFLNEWLTCFASTRGVLLADGKVETLMHARV